MGLGTCPHPEESAGGFLAWQFTTQRAETSSSGRPGPVLEELWYQGPGRPLGTWLEGERGHICGRRVLSACS